MVLSRCGRRRPPRGRRRRGRRRRARARGGGRPAPVARSKAVHHNRAFLFFIERSQQQEATPSFAYCSLCMLLRRCARHVTP
jgi:hypothetical protein